jgi:hypothetical protein
MGANRLRTYLQLGLSNLLNLLQSARILESCGSVCVCVCVEENCRVYLDRCLNPFQDTECLGDK